MVLVDQTGGHVADYLDSMRPFRWCRRPSVAWRIFHG